MAEVSVSSEPWVVHISNVLHHLIGGHLGWFCPFLLEYEIQRGARGMSWAQSETADLKLITQWSETCVWLPFASSIAFALLFVFVEVYIAVEPVLPRYLLTQKVPVLVGFSNALVAVCNLSVTYYFPTWFQTVMLSSASTAGE